MFGNVYVLLDDTGKEQYTKTYYTEDPIEFTKLNDQGRGVYCSVNTFEATEEQMKEKWVKTKRNIPFLKKINAVFADIDIAKKGDNQTREQKEEKKKTLLSELMKICEPSCVLDTSNGIQPLWIIGDYPIDEASQKRYIALINGIIERSKTVWAAGDAVKDVTRILRLPWYKHMKGEPYPITVKTYSDRDITIEEMEQAFGSYIPQKAEFNREMPQREQREMQTSKQYQEVERLDFKEVIIRAFWAVGRSCEFDNQDRLVIDWRLTGNFIGKNGDRRYIGSTSHEAFAGNMITAVWEIMQVSNKEAYKWILDTFNIKTESELWKNKIEVPKTQYEKQGYLYPNKVFDAFDCVMSGELMTVVAASNSWKTTFAMDIIQVNASRWKKCYYINLEFPIETMREGRRLFINNKKKRNLTDIDPLSDDDRVKMDIYVQQKLKQFDYYNNPNGMAIEDIVQMIIDRHKQWYWLFVIDTFSRITGNLNSATAHTSQNKTMEILQELCQNLWVVVMLLHHTNKNGVFEWTQKIMDLSNVFVMISKDEDMSGNAITKFILTKDKFVSRIELDTYYVNHEYTLETPKYENPF